MYCFAPILEVAEVFEMTPFFSNIWTKKMTAHAVISTVIALIKAQLEKLSNKTKTRDKIEFGKNIESGQFEMNFASHKTLMQRNKSIDLNIRRMYLVEGAVFCRLSDSLASPVKKMSDIPLQDTELEMYDISY